MILELSAAAAVLRRPGLRAAASADARSVGHRKEILGVLHADILARLTRRVRPGSFFLWLTTVGKWRRAARRRAGERACSASLPLSPL